MGQSPGQKEVWCAIHIGMWSTEIHSRKKSNLKSNIKPSPSWGPQKEWSKTPESFSQWLEEGVVCSVMPWRNWPKWPGGIKTNSILPILLPPHRRSLHTRHYSTLLAAKRCITNLWLSPAPATMHLLVTHVKSYLHMDRIYVERNPEAGAKHFFKKWRRSMLCHLSREETRQVMLPFKNTSWYLTGQLAGTLGDLEVT